MIQLNKIAELPEFKYETVGETYIGSQAPTPHYEKNFKNQCRLWFSARDSKNRSFPFYYDLSLNCINYGKPVNKTEKYKIYELGKPGTFNDSGIMPSQIIGGQYFSDHLMLFVGWNKGSDEAKYRLSLGTSKVERLSEPTIKLYMDRSRMEEIGLSMPFIDHTDETLYYMSVRGWKDGECHYDIRAVDTKSFNLGKDYIPYSTILSGHACFARPWIRQGTQNRPKQLWYCYRAFEDFRENKKNSYKLGVLELVDGEWFPANHKLDTSGLGDNLMEAYPAIIDTEFGNFLFYNSSFTGAIQIAEVIDD